jgi:hypothetical protein
VTLLGAEDRYSASSLVCMVEMGPGSGCCGMSGIPIVNMVILTGSFSRAIRTSSGARAEALSSISVARRPISARSSASWSLVDSESASAIAATRTCTRPSVFQSPAPWISRACCLAALLHTKSFGGGSMMRANTDGGGADGIVNRGIASGGRVVRWLRTAKREERLDQYGASTDAGRRPAMGGVGDCGGMSTRATNKGREVGYAAIVWGRSNALRTPAIDMPSMAQKPFATPCTSTPRPSRNPSQRRRTVLEASSVRASARSSLSKR